MAIQLPLHMETPRKVGVPHDSWYTNQANALAQFIGTSDKFNFFEMPTGSGKSAIPTALASDQDVLVVVGTLNLLSQYENLYGFDVIRGRSSYPCVLQKKLDLWKDRNRDRPPTAADCHYSPMHDCKSSGSCPYLVAKERGLNSNKLAVTYKYAFLSHKIYERMGLIVCDEAHETAEQIIGFATFECSEYDLNMWNLPPFPFINYGSQGKGDLLNTNSTPIIMNWLHDCVQVFKYKLAGIPKIDERASKIKRACQKYETMIEHLYSPESRWFLECRRDLIFYRGKTYPGMRLRPLDPSTIANRLWKNKQRVIFMSATIGDAEPLAQALGVNHFYYKTYPHPIPSGARPIIDLEFDRMTYSNIKNDPRIFLRQAIKISSWIKRQTNPDWRGIILTSSYDKIRQLGIQLESRVDDRRLIVQQPGIPLADITERFLEDKQPGDILLASIQGFGQGLDLRGDLARFSIIAGVPFDNYTDRYEQLRKQINGKYGWWRSYNAVPQGTGRVTRGERNGDGEYLTNYGILADGSATTKRAFEYYPSWFRDAIE